MTPTARRRWEALQGTYPSWEEHLHVTESGDLTVYVPSPNPQVGGLTVLTLAEDTWIRFSPPQMGYPVDDNEEMLLIVRRLLADELLFVRITRDERWTGTTLIPTDGEPPVESGEVAQVLSWTGQHDRTTGEAA